MARTIHTILANIGKRMPECFGASSLRSREGRGSPAPCQDDVQIMEGDDIEPCLLYQHLIGALEHLKEMWETMGNRKDFGGYIPLDVNGVYRTPSNDLSELHME